jgi:hypothetical protein
MLRRQEGATTAEIAKRRARRIAASAGLSEAVSEMQLPGALLSFQCKFESLSEDQTRITQRLTLCANAEALVAQASMFGKEIQLPTPPNYCFWRH